MREVLNKRKVQLSQEEPFELEDAAWPLLKAKAWQSADPRLSVGMSTRGPLKGQPMAYNTALHVQDKVTHVLQHREALERHAGFDSGAWTCCEQVHGHRISHIENKHRGAGRLDRKSAAGDADAMITAQSGIMLAMFYADCVPLFFRVNGTDWLAMAHAGWRGTVQRVAAHTVQHLLQHSQVAVQEIEVLLGPSIQACCYQVGDEVAEQVRKVAPALLLNRILTVAGENIWHLDLQELNRQIMIEERVPAENIAVSGWCTSCRTDLLFSHREEQGNCGRMTAWIGRP